MTVGTAGGNWFDYSAVSPLEGSPRIPFTLQARMEEEEEEMSEARRGSGIGKQWEDVRVSEVGLGDQGGEGSGEDVRIKIQNATGQADRTSSGWVSVPLGEVSRNGEV